MKTWTKITLLIICMLTLLGFAGATPKKTHCFEMGRPVKCQVAPPLKKHPPKPLDCPGWDNPYPGLDGCGQP